MSEQALLEMRGITKRWKDLLVLDDVDLVLRPGSLVWLGGANGVGKTTLLRIATGLIKPDAGSISLAGLDPDRKRRAFCQRTGFVSAGDRGLYARLTVRENLDFGAGIAFLRGARREAAIATAIERFDLGPLERKRVDRMSMGQRQRVRLALALLHEPDLVLLDEPRTSLDQQGTERLRSALQEVVRRGGTALWCSPVNDDDGLSADHELVLEQGKLRPR